MKIIIAGAGAVGTHLAKLLSREHHDITLMDESPEKLEDLSSNFDILTCHFRPRRFQDCTRPKPKKPTSLLALPPTKPTT